MDPSATNLVLGEPLIVPLEHRGIHVRQIAAGAHFQLGKVESHGGWFNRVLEKIEFPPTSYDEWIECVSHAHIKNSMLQHRGITPYQLVFGRNPDIPEDLLSEPQRVVSATASLTDEAIDRANKIRLSAREAVIRLQDDRALRLALAARPRVVQDFKPGDMVAYWRSPKRVQGKLMLGGKWYGTAIVLGKVGRNYVLAHRKQILRAAPEQVRNATSEETTLLQTPGTAVAVPTAPVAEHVPVDGVHPPEVPMPDAEVSPPVISPSINPMGNDESSTYGPMRKVRGKNGPDALWRPPSMKQEDFVSIMQEVHSSSTTFLSRNVQRPLLSQHLAVASLTSAVMNPRCQILVMSQQLQDSELRRLDMKPCPWNGWTHVIALRR